jgi:glycosyltransferase involved in cell wall biosynthesis
MQQTHHFASPFAVTGLRAMFITGSMESGGAEHHAIALMNGLSEGGHECHAVYVKNGPMDLEQRLRLAAPGTLRCLGAVRYLDRRAVVMLAGHMASIVPGVVIAANPYALMYSWLALRLSRVGAPLVATCHSTRFLGAREQLQMALYRPFLWTSTCAVFVCEAQKRHWLRRGALSRRNEVIYNGVDTEHFSVVDDPAGRTELRRALKLGKSDYVIGMAAMLRPEKNHMQLLDALVRLRARGLPAKALLVGEGEMRAAIEARAATLGVSEHVVLAGLQKDVRPYIRACDVMLLCSFSEAFSMAAIEAMALGRPVVHSEVGGAAEMIAPGENGYLFPVGDTGELVERLSALSKPALAERMGRKARRMVEAYFSEPTMLDRYERLLQGLCTGRASLDQTAYS